MRSGLRVESDVNGGKDTRWSSNVRGVVEVEFVSRRGHQLKTVSTVVSFEMISLGKYQRTKIPPFQGDQMSTNEKIKINYLQIYY